MKYWRDYIDQVKAHSLYRTPSEYRPTGAVQGQQDGKTYLMLSSNNYLGLTHHPKVCRAAAAATEQYGTGSGGARLTTGSHPCFRVLEEQLADFKGTEAAVVFNTGYMANLGTISAIAGKGDIIFSDELNHASIIDGCRLSKAQTVIYRHADMEHLRQLLNGTPCSGQRLIVTDSVFSMDGDIAPLPEIVSLAEEYGAMVMVDDAHAVGVIGRGGRGSAEYFGLKGRIHIQLGTLSKALAAEGGYVAGSRDLIEYLINKSRSYIFSTALAPAAVAAASAALAVLSSQPELVDKLRANSDLMRSLLTAAGLKVEGSVTPILPIVVGDADKAVKLAGLLKKQGLVVTAIRPPTVMPGSSRLRLTVSAAHKTEELQKAAAVIIAAAQEIKLI